uniref:Plastid light harvesting protein n=1 Tax=Chromera velia CCMP2878 TaxID=1169474 RepID=A0A0G4FN06_9ALVE|mmetsp:Transcript_55915/g.109442  ORF Transcript_55915/g.109442 Transcript_55915/m.109442 type:complete len:267 (+) Transcript_55915:97-897(+)|eukprot:Cvel_3532.t1-p1 / transcript=Cvel_3532.t1 / gene=Cvel_3532 / organism=Chromera_velia_CCMP2878 / gene_product=Fucoxanthin-chlorophyll a-c binding protein B,, putative / transcript_product=Fucoxanthin-chlorophyll a-c binding protein B,, putative / location=Cvel_scaffold144:5633-9990(-) / protein_length=266 / sequence_SO=supercontig / SO=protein_coding / is_pseudo=false
MKAALCFAALSAQSAAFQLRSVAPQGQKAQAVSSLNAGLTQAEIDFNAREERIFAQRVEEYKKAMSQNAGVVPYPDSADVDGRPLDAPYQLFGGDLAGDLGWDPLNLAEGGDIVQLREAELRHGRLAMLATLGVLVQSTYRWDSENFPSKNFLDALFTAPPLGIFQIFAAIGWWEFKNKDYEGRIPGDRGFDPLGLSKNGIRPQWEKSELEHGRLAMFMFLGMLVQQLLSPKESIVEQTISWTKSLGVLPYAITTPEIDQILAAGA